METEQPSRSPNPRARRERGRAEPGHPEPGHPEPGHPGAGPRSAWPRRGRTGRSPFPAVRARPAWPAFLTWAWRAARPVFPASRLRPRTRWTRFLRPPSAASAPAPADLDQPRTVRRAPAPADLNQSPAAPAPAPADLNQPPGSGESASRAQPDMTLPRVRVSGPADILAVVPHLIGFHPGLSFVVIGAAGPRRRVELGFRYDLPDPPGAAAAAEIADHAVAVLAQRGASTVIGIGYGPGRLVTPIADAFAAAASRRRLQLRELLRVEDGRYWSYLCTNAACCPAEGTAFDYRSHPAAAAMTVAGLAAYPDRDAVAATLAPPAGAAATRHGRGHRAGLRTGAGPDGPSAARRGRQPAAAGGQPGPQGGAGSDRASIAAAAGSPTRTGSPGWRSAWSTLPFVMTRGRGWSPSTARRTCRCGRTSCAGPKARGCPHRPRCSPSPPGSPVTGRSPTSPWTGLSPPTRNTPWHCCYATSSRRECRPRRRACR